jgi:hypothetical protein
MAFRIGALSRAYALRVAAASPQRTGRMSHGSSADDFGRSSSLSLYDDDWFTHSPPPLVEGNGQSELKYNIHFFRDTNQSINQLFWIYYALWVNPPTRQTPGFLMMSS